MSHLTDADLLTLFEHGQGVSTLQRARLLGAAILGEQEVNTRPISDLDRAAWSLRQSMIGGPAEATCTCPDCAAQLEFELPVGFELPDRTADTATITLDTDEYAIRLPTLRDVSATGLLVTNLSDDAPWDNPQFRQTAETALSRIDPLLDLRLTMTCADCGGQTNHPFDVTAFVWAELEDRAHHLVTQITTLARHFGWSERDILGMSARRRALYLAQFPS